MINFFQPIYNASLELPRAAKLQGYESHAHAYQDCETLREELSRLIDRRLEIGLPATRDGYAEGRAAWEWDVKRALADLRAAADQMCDIRAALSAAGWEENASGRWANSREWSYANELGQHVGVPVGLTRGSRDALEMERKRPGDSYLQHVLLAEARLVKARDRVMSLAQWIDLNPKLEPNETRSEHGEGAEIVPVVKPPREPSPAFGSNALERARSALESVFEAECIPEGEAKLSSLELVSRLGKRSIGAALAEALIDEMVDAGAFVVKDGPSPIEIRTLTPLGGGEMIDNSRVGRYLFITRDRWQHYLATQGAGSETQGEVEDLAPYMIEEQPWWAPVPPAKDTRTDELISEAGRIDVVLITATDGELEAVLRKLAPYPKQEAVLKGYAEQETYYLGTFGSCVAALTKCRMGSLDAGGASLATQHAQHVWRPRAIVMTGIGMGKNPAKQKIADVLVASQVISYEPQRVGETQTIHRGPGTPVNPTLLNRFENVPHWSFCRPDGTRCQREVGPVLSGEKLVDNQGFKASLLHDYPQAIGGDMEGVGLAAAAIRHGVPWIVVKAICDWGDGKKDAKHQALAAAAAVSLVHHVLSQTDVLHGLQKLP